MAKWKLSEVSRVTLPPTGQQTGSEEDSNDSELDEEYIEAPEKQEGSEEPENALDSSEENEQQGDMDDKEGDEEELSDASDSSDTDGDDTSDDNGSDGVDGEDESDTGSDTDDNDASDDDASDSTPSGMEDEPEEDSENEGESKASVGEDSGEDSGEEFEEEDLLDSCLKEALDDLHKNPPDIESMQEVSADMTDRISKMSSGMVVPPTVVKLVQVKGPVDICKARLEAGQKLFGNLGVRLRNLFSDRNSRKVTGGLKKGKRISSKDIHKLQTDRYQGKLPRIWKREMQGKNQDAAVSIAIDNSGSMNGDKQLLAECISAALGTTLQRMRVPFNMLGYTDHGNSGALQINVVKSFEERDFDIKRCLFPRMGCTPELEALMFIGPLLLARPEPKKILFVICDGGGGEPGHIERYLNKLRSMGVLIFGFGMEADLSSYYGEDFIKVSHSDMPSFSRILISKLTKLLT